MIKVKEDRAAKMQKIFDILNAMNQYELNDVEKFIDEIKEERQSK